MSKRQPFPFVPGQGPGRIERITNLPPIGVLLLQGSERRVQIDITLLGKDGGDTIPPDFSPD